MTERPRPRSKRRLLIAAGVLAIPAVALAWWLGSPLFLDTEVDEAFPTVESASLSPENDQPTPQSAETGPPETPATLAPESEQGAAEPVRLLHGSFVDADTAHRGSGSATILALEDGSHVVRFEGFEVTNGPDLHVLMVPTTEPIDRASLAEVGYDDLGKLKGNVGNQNYDLPEGFDPDGPWTVVIYCEPFHVVFSTAQLSG